MLKYMRFVILFDTLFNSSFKMTTCFANIGKSTAITSKLYTKKDFEELGLYMANNF